MLTSNVEVERNRIEAAMKALVTYSRISIVLGLAWSKTLRQARQDSRTLDKTSSLSLERSMRL